MTLSSNLPVRVQLQVRDESNAVTALALADGIEELYQQVFARFQPFSERPCVVEPHAPPAKWRSTPPTISVLYPDRTPAVVSYVEPASPPFGVPRLRLKHRDSEPRLLGRGDVPGPLLAHELAHALHFSLMPVRRRSWITTTYLGWISLELLRGRPGTHSTFQHTSPMVAWLEAFGVFAERYWRHKQDHPNATADELDESFLAAESGLAPCRNDLVGSFSDSGFRPACPGVDVEGTIYGLVFVDLARQTSLATAVNLYLASARSGVLDYRQFTRALAHSPVRLGKAE